MGLRTSIYSVLNGDSTVSGLVGTRIRPEVGYPQENAQQITYSSTEEPVYHSEGKASLVKSSITFTCWGVTPAEADAVFDAVAAEMESSAGPRTFGDIYVQSLFRVRADSEAVATTVTSENVPDFYMRQMEYRAVWH